MSYAPDDRPAPKFSSTNVVLIVLAVVGVVVLSCGVVFIVVAITAIATLLDPNANGSFTMVASTVSSGPTTPSIGDARVKAEQFLERIGRNDVGNAHNLLTLERQRQMTEAKLQELVDQNSALAKQRSFSLNATSTGIDTARINAEVKGADGSTLTVVLDMKSVLGTWQIDQVRIQR
jgi:hypothetical protein